MLLLREQILNVLTTKKWKLCDTMEKLVKVVVVTTLQYTSGSNSVHLIHQLYINTAWLGRGG